MRALIDADSIVYAAGFASDKRSDPLEFNLQLTKKVMHGILMNSACDSFIPYLTGSDSMHPNFRSVLYSDYKANRTAKKPVYFQEIRDYLTDVWRSEYVFGMEADDAIAIDATAGIDSVIIVSIDKDLWTVPGWHYNWRKKTPLEYVTEHEALVNFYRQLLIGDTSDNVPGCPGIGVVKAAKIITDAMWPEHAMYRSCIGAYASAYGGTHAEPNDEPIAENAVHRAATLLWMTRELDLGEPVLWTPPNPDGTRQELSIQERAALFEDLHP